MRLEILRFEFTDETHRTPVDHIKPVDPEDFLISAEFYVREQNDYNEMQFEVDICSPKAILSGKVPENDIFMGRHYIIMNSFDEDRLKGFITSYVSSLVNLPLKEQIQKLCRLGQWEYEDVTDDYDSPVPIQMLLEGS